MATTGTGLAPSRMLRNLSPADPFRSLQSRINRLFEEGFGLAPFADEAQSLSSSLSSWSPACDIYETENEIVVKAELPEVKKDDVHVSLENNVLTIRGERKFEDESKRENYHRIERSYGEFVRSFTLPAIINSDKIGAEFKDGVLRVTLPKREEAKPKQIEVTVK
jgi:HSP20 family protein